MKNDSQWQNPLRRLFFTGSIFLALTWLAFSAAQTQTTNDALGTAALLVGPSAGTNSVVLAVTPANGPWTATANAAWLHLSLANQSGTGSTNVIFSYDANPGPTRSNTLTIGGQMLTVTQAGSTYVGARPVTTLVQASGTEPDGYVPPFGVAVDGAGNVYIADTLNLAIKELPYAFVDPTPKLEGLAAGNDALPVVLPSTENLRAPFAPASDQSWLTITGITNGVVRSP